MLYVFRYDNKEQIERGRIKSNSEDKNRSIFREEYKQNKIEAICLILKKVDTVMYQVKYRITPITEWKRNGNGSETEREWERKRNGNGNGTIDKDVFSLIKSRAEDTK